MTMPPTGQYGSSQPKVDARRLWSGGLAAAVIAALVAIVGILVARGIFDVEVLAPKRSGAWGDADTGLYALGAAIATLLATGLIHLLILFVPRYSLFFGWIMVLATAIGVVVPFGLNVDTSAKVATSLINLALGITIGSLVSAVANSAVRAAAIGDFT